MSRTAVSVHVCWHLILCVTFFVFTDNVLVLRLASAGFLVAMRDALV